MYNLMLFVSSIIDIIKINSDFTISERKKLYKVCPHSKFRWWLIHDYTITQ